MTRELNTDSHEGDPNKRSVVGLVIAGLIALFVLGAGAIAAVVLVSRFSGHSEDVVAEPIVDRADPPEIVEEPLVEEPPPPQEKPRYIPGPYVSVVGVLPAGHAAVSSLTNARNGHTMNNPWFVPGAELSADAPPPVGNVRAPQVASGDLQITPRVPNEFPIETSGTIAGLAIRFVGYEGFFYLPASVNTELGAINIGGGFSTFQFGTDVPAHPNGQQVGPDQQLHATMEVAAIDMNGMRSPWVSRALRVLPVGKGDLEVTLTMDQATDLDLYVIEPTGQTIYYGNTTTSTGGRLDLDANAACSNNVGVNNEHIYWSRSAPAGRYEVRVSNFTSCINGDQVNYRVTVQNCGETAVLSGSFTGRGGGSSCQTQASNPAECQQVVTFEVDPCVH